MREFTVFLFQNDADGSGTIDFPEFLSLISKRQREMLENEVTLKPKFLHFELVTTTSSVVSALEM